MTLYLLFERLDAHKIKLDTPLKVSAKAAEQPSSYEAPPCAGLFRRGYHDRMSWLANIGIIIAKFPQEVQHGRFSALIHPNPSSWQCKVRP
jgi:hypothetical protein